MDHKIEKRVYELFEKGHANDDIQNVNIKKEILSELLPYQTLHAFNMITAVKNNKITIDGSYTGTGKTYTTIAICAQLGLKPFIICPKNIISKWKEVCDKFGVECIGIINYESIRSLKYINSEGKKETCPYIKKTDKSYTWDFSSFNQTLTVTDQENKSNKGYKKNKSNVPLNNAIIIFDEVHKCKNYKSMNGKLLLSAKNGNQRTLMISATLCDRNSDFGIFGMMLGFYNNIRQGKAWIDAVIREDMNQISKNKVNTLHKYLFPEKGSKMSLEDLGDTFPMNQVIAESYTLDDSSIEKINVYYKSIDNNKLKLEELGEARQNIENLKVPIIVEMMENYHELNKSVVIFVNYLSTYSLILEHLEKLAIAYAEINGAQDIKERTEQVVKFQNNEVRIMVAMIQAGGSSISLHDETGKFPRVSIISPSYSSIELIQALGRIYRSTTKTPCLQRIIYCSGTYEDNVVNILRKKKDFMKSITDDELLIRIHKK